MCDLGRRWETTNPELMVPGYSEVGWMMPDGWTPYWRGRNVRSELEYVTAAPPAAS
jgi:hypothetical protein